MGIQEYLHEQKLLEVKFLDDKKLLAKKFALHNNPYKIGDIISDHIGDLIIRQIGVFIDYNKPSCFYTGIELKKDGTPTKKQTNRSVYQINIKTT